MTISICLDNNFILIGEKTLPKSMIINAPLGLDYLLIYLLDIGLICSAHCVTINVIQHNPMSKSHITMCRRAVTVGSLAERAIPDSKVHGPYMGPHVGPKNLAIMDFICRRSDGYPPPTQNIGI